MPQVSTIGQRLMYNAATLTLFKGIVSRDSVSTETIGVQFRPKQKKVYICKVTSQKYTMLQTGGLSMKNGGDWISLHC
jgi:hypothetical protein